MVCCGHRVWCVVGGWCRGWLGHPCCVLHRITDNRLTATAQQAPCPSLRSSLSLLFPFINPLPILKSHHFGKRRYLSLHKLALRLHSTLIFRPISLRKPITLDCQPCPDSLQVYGFALLLKAKVINDSGQTGKDCCSVKHNEIHDTPLKSCKSA